MLQAYTVELEAELNHLKEENARLKAEEVLTSENKRRFSYFFFLLLLNFFDVLLQTKILLAKKQMVHSVICQLFFLEHAEVLKQSMYVC
jgi:hypothetical protein